jgi:membrane dipeptidase
LKIKSLGGLVGINLCTYHLSSKENVDINDVMNHIEHYLSLGGEDCLAMGCDLDGTDLPIGFSGVSDIYKIAEEMQKLNYSDTLIKKILFENAHNFFIKNI